MYECTSTYTFDVKVVSYKKTCSSKSFLSVRLSSTRLLIKWFLIKKNV